MAAAAMATQQCTLGAINTNPDQMRTLSGTAWECTDNNKLNDGTSIQDAATAMAKKGIHLAVYDSSDGRDFDDIVAFLKIGRFAIVHGDYDQIPVKLRGDKDFLGYHSVYWQEYRASVSLYNGTKGPGIRVGDGLNDGRRTGIPNGYVWWPASVAKNYAAKFPGGGFTFGIIDKRRIEARVEGTNVRSGTSTKTASIRKLHKGDELVWGAMQLGQSVGGDRRWYRVWEPIKARVAYVHASVAHRI